MARTASPDLTRFAAWPVATLSARPSGEVIGVVLPRVVGHKEIHTLYSPAHRKFTFPEQDWSFLVHVALNCAAAFDSIHAKSHVIGDVNQGNVLVSRDGTVFLIDCDSFQVNSNGKLFVCEVGVPEFTPPELQGAKFRGVVRTTNHDRFGLAVVIFRLLFMGRHPYVGRYLAQGEMPMERAIREFRFAFSKAATSLQMERPPHTLALDQVTPSLVPLFERAFCRGSEVLGTRPTANDWHSALLQLKAQTRFCGGDRGHRYFANLSSCPWCLIVRNGGPNFFISVTVHASTHAVFKFTANIEMLWRPIQAVQPPKSVFIMPPPPLEVISKPPPSGSENSMRLQANVRYAAIANAIALCFAVVIPLLAYFAIPGAIIFGLWWAGLAATSPYVKEKRRRRAIRRDRQEELRDAKKIWDGAFSDAGRSFNAILERLSRSSHELERLKSNYDGELYSLEKNREAQQLRSFLQSKFVSDYRIEKIGSGRQAVLASYGIETAYDIDRSRILRISGFGPALTASLVNWRRSVEATFRFDPSKEIPVSERQALNMKYAQEQALTRVRAAPRSGRTKGSCVQGQGVARRNRGQNQRREEALAQADADLAIMR